MATLSRRTLSAACRIIAEWSHTAIDELFYENEVPAGLDPGGNRVNRIMGVFKRYEGANDTQMLTQLLESAMLRMRNESRQELQEALGRDGFVFVNGDLVDSEPQSQENRSAMEAILQKHAGDVDVDTLKHHLRESINLFRQEKWDSSISHCRNFVEQLLSDIAGCIAASRSETPSLSRPAQVRDYLESTGFFDPAERKKLVDGVYGYFSEEGSHPGISSQSAARVSNSILSSFGLYLVEKLDSWKSGHLGLK